MVNLTITVDEEILKKARIRALEQGTSINAVLAAHLKRYAGYLEAQDRAIDNLLTLAEQVARKAEKEGRARRRRRRPTRDELHERKPRR